MVLHPIDHAFTHKISSVWSSQPRQLSLGTDVRCTAIDDPKITSAALSGILVSSATSQISSLRRPILSSAHDMTTPNR
jgi:hypothetical protein